MLFFFLYCQTVVNVQAIFSHIDSVVRRAIITKEQNVTNFHTNPTVLWGEKPSPPIWFLHIYDLHWDFLWMLSFFQNPELNQHHYITYGKSEAIFVTSTIFQLYDISAVLPSQSWFSKYSRPALFLSQFLQATACEQSSPGNTKLHLLMVVTLFLWLACR